MFTVQDGAILIASCFTASSGARNNIVFQGRQFGTLDWQDINFGAVAGGTHISLQDTASGSCTGPYMIGNNAAVHVSATHSNLRLNCAISVPYPLAFTAFMQLMDKAIAYAGAATFSGPGAGSATIGTKYQVSDSTLNLGATLFPGNEIEAPTYGGVIK
jgi:outer membrane receptor for monomeric catechols